MQVLRTGQRRAIVEESEEGCAMKSGRRRVLSLGMGVALAVWAPLSALAAWENPFRDVGAGDWFYGAVEYVNTAELFDGTGAEAFSPQEAMTRGMFVKVLGCAAGVVPGGESASRFADVPEDAYYAPYVAWAAETGVVKGTSDTTFSPEEPITREDMAVMLYQYAEARGFDTSYDGANLLDFPDAGEISEYAQVPMAWAVTQGVLAGSGGYLEPKGVATRAETAQIFYNSDEVLSTKVDDPTLDRVWVVDEPGHYETVERLELVEVTVGEVGHWEEAFRTHWVYRCNTCGYTGETIAEINAHLQESAEQFWETGTRCSGYTMVSSKPEYTGEWYWVVDEPGHTEYQWQTVTEEVWVEEVGHWEYK